MRGGGVGVRGVGVRGVAARATPLQGRQFCSHLYFYYTNRGPRWQYALLHHCEIEKERNVLFNDALNTFYLWLYGVRHMVKDHSDSEKGNPLPPHRLLLSINSKGSFICTIPQTG